MSELIPHPEPFLHAHHNDLCFFANPTGFYAVKNTCTCALITYVTKQRDTHHDNPCMICGPHAEYSTYICPSCEEELANEAAYDGGEL